MKLFRYSYSFGKPVAWKHRELIPVSRALVLSSWRLPLGLVWNRPAGVIVREKDGSEQWLQVHDFTRRAQVVFLVMAILTMLIAWQGRGR